MKSKIVCIAFLLFLFFLSPLAILSQPSIWTWGGNCSGQLGCADETACPGTNWGDCGGPIELRSLAKICAVSAGSAHSLAIDTDGNVWSWGNNFSGQLGIGNLESLDHPVRIPDLTEVVKISGGAWGSLALENDGTVWQWGYFGPEPCGNCGPPDGLVAPMKVANLEDVENVAAWGYTALVLKKDGTVWAWGNNASGQLGDGTNVDSDIPVQVEGLADIIWIDDGMALRSDGTVWQWSGTVFPAQPIPGFTNVYRISSGSDHKLAIKDDGSLWAWGGNMSGQLGNGTKTPSVAPIQVAVLANVTAVSGGDRFSVATTGDGKVWAWGSNYWKQLGNGTTDDNPLPENIAVLEGIGAVSTGWVHTIALQVAPPEILSAKALDEPFRVKVSGQNFHQDAKVYIGEDTSPLEKVKFKNIAHLILKGGNSLKERFPKGVPVEIKVVNGDGGSATFTYTR
ncbi:MAG TPA: hypothetical protein PK747_00145 [Acidobacteriota bacterium]|nr:hypothetical protein [Acidobacteriota bacterium]HQQ45804.1 hypothetical protein [Acidobacteriota bacterium]